MNKGVKYKILTGFLFCLLWVFYSYAQNLVPNGSFEIDTACPFNMSGWMGISMLAYAVPWDYPTQGTADYYSSCDTTGVVGVRFNEKLNRYEVSWVNASGKQGKTSVSINKHGKDKAFLLACDIRKAKESERLGVAS